ncbi:MAG: hypothetical protein ABMA13_06400 [Chthoniobacteraceae bacterium]
MDHLESLTALEKRYADAHREYADALAHVRSLIALEKRLDGGASSPLSIVIGDTPPASSDNVRSGDEFASLTKAEAAEKLIRERGDLRVEAIFNSMKARGHPVATVRALASMLSADKRFAPRGGGVWGLRQPELSAA